MPRSNRDPSSPRQRIRKAAYDAAHPVHLMNIEGEVMCGDPKGLVTAYVAKTTCPACLKILNPRFAP